MSQSTTSCDLTTGWGTHYSVLQHHILRPEDRERYTLQYLTALHHRTWWQREAHITVSHRTASYDLTIEWGTNYSVSQCHIVRPDDRESYTLQCLTVPHHRTWRQREVHITVSHSTTAYDLTTEKVAHFSVLQHHILRPDDREVHITVSHITTSYDLTTERVKHYSISRLQIVRPDDRERYTFQCVTAPNRTTWRQSEVHITMPHSTTSFDLLPSQLRLQSFWWILEPSSVLSSTGDLPQTGGQSL